MADYVVVPYSNYTDAPNVYTDGIEIAVVGNIKYKIAHSYRAATNFVTGVYTVANGSTTEYVLCFLYKPQILSGNYYLRLVYKDGDSSAQALNNFGLGYGNSSVLVRDGWYTFSSFYYSGIPYPADSINVTVYNNREDCINAMLRVIVNPGVHVEFHPVYILSFPGVHVSFNPVLLDPNAQGGTSVPGGGDGTFDETSDAIPVPSLPSISTVDTGLVTLFRPSQQQVADLGAYLWTHLTDFWENLQKLFTNPMDYFIAFNIFPVVPEVLLSRRIYIGNWGTNISMPPVANQWYEFDCGTVTLQKYWGSALDYAPNTKVQLMLPYIGSVQLNTDEVMGQQIGLKYRIDLLSGSCVAMVTVNGNVLYQFTGECSVSIPLTGADWSRIYSAVTGAVGTAITGVAGAMASGAAAGAATSAVASKNVAKAAHEAGYLARSIGEIPKGVRGAPAMRQALQEAAQISVGAAKEAAQASGNVSAGIRTSRILGAINNTVGQVMGGKASTSHSGTISGAAGMLGVRDAYLIIEFPNQSLAKDYKHFVGYPSNMYARLGTLSGYTEVEQVIPEGIWGTDDEMAELVDALKGGVYL